MGEGLGTRLRGHSQSVFQSRLTNLMLGGGGGGGGEGGEGGRGCDVKIDTCVPNISFVQFFYSKLHCKSRSRSKVASLLFEVDSVYYLHYFCI